MSHTNLGRSVQVLQELRSNLNDVSWAGASFVISQPVSLFDFPKGSLLAKMMFREMARQSPLQHFMMILGRSPGGEEYVVMSSLLNFPDVNRDCSILFWVFTPGKFLDMTWHKSIWILPTLQSMTTFDSYVRQRSVCHLPPQQQDLLDSWVRHRLRQPHGQSYIMKSLR